MHVLPTETFFIRGQPQVRAFQSRDAHMDDQCGFTNYSGTRTYGSSVLFAADPAKITRRRWSSWAAAGPSTSTTEIIDLSAGHAEWVNGPSMSQPRIEMKRDDFAEWQILALGGSLNDEDTNTASPNADLYDPRRTRLVPREAMVYARLYHSVSLLMPDGTVWVRAGIRSAARMSRTWKFIRHNIY